MPLLTDGLVFETAPCHGATLTARQSRVFLNAVSYAMSPWLRVDEFDNSIILHIPEHAS